MPTKECQNCRKTFEKPYTLSASRWLRAKFCSSPCFGQTLKRPCKSRVWVHVPRKPLTAEHKAKIAATRLARGGYKKYPSGRSPQGIANSILAKRNWKQANKDAVNQHTRIRRYKLRGAQGTHTLSEWVELKRQYDYMCLCCKRREPDIILTEDHKKPISMGGSNDISNIQPLCKSCNSIKFTAHLDFIQNISYLV